ncbi:MAG: hypothetical protein SWK90_15755 [Chloroflexota bacterium]|nr:hypothetical protein [Chloroflexota bacterium]
MTARRALWPVGVAGLMLLLAGLGCSLCSLVPQPEPIHTLVGEATPSLEPTAVPTLTPTQEPPPEEEMSMYADPLAGFSISYPADWIYEAEGGGVYFARDEGPLEYFDPAEGPMLAVMTVSRDEVELEFGSDVTTEDLLDNMLEGLSGGEGTTIGEIESWTFGEIPGLGVEASWADEWSGGQLHGYMIATVDQVVGFGFGTSLEADWPSYAPIFQDMFASLEFFPPDVPEPVERGPIQPGEMVEGRLPPGGVDIWYFEAEEGYASIRLDAAVPDVLDPYLELYNEDGVIIAEDDDGGDGYNALIVDFPVVVSGNYVIHALTYSGEGDYTLSLEIAAEPSGEMIEYGQMVEEVLAGDARHSWFFQGAEGDVVTIVMSALDEYLDCRLELYGPGGAALTDDDDSGEGLDALIEYYELPADGVYRIVASNALFGVAEAYELTLERTEMVIEGTLTYGDVLRATLESGTRHHWLFEGEEGDVVTISMIAVNDDIDTYLELFAPNGVRVMSDDDSGGEANAEISTFELPLSGDYRIVARGYDDIDVGEYELTLIGQ